MTLKARCMFGTIWDPEVVSCVIIDHNKVFRFLSPLLPQNSDCYWIPSPRAEASVFHQDPLKLFESIHEISEQLRSKVSESCKDVASKLTEADVDFFPMIAQNWFIDIFLHILPIDAAVRLWDRIILDKMPEVPVKFALNLLLLSKNDILICSPEDLNDVVADLPKRIQTPADVDWLLDSSDSSKVDAVTVNLIEKVETCEVTPFVVPLKFSKRRWQPWKFLTVAMVIPWLLMHVTQVHPRAGRTARPARPMVVHHLASPVALNEAWPTWPMWNSDILQLGVEKWLPKDEWLNVVWLS